MSRPTRLGASIRAFSKRTLASWPDLRSEVAHVVAEDDWVMGPLRRDNHVHDRGHGVAPSGAQVVTTFWELHRFDEAGLIVQTWNLMDGLAIMHLLGLLPSRAAG